MIKTGKKLAASCLYVAENYKTLYIMGCFGAPMTAENKKRYTSNHKYNKQTERTRVINAATPDTFGFDCVNLIKGLLWGWCGDKSKTYGGATYLSNRVPDLRADLLIQKCKDLSTDFSTIQVGEAVWMSGHIGVYVGDGLAVECTPKWDDGVQVTAVHNIGKKAGYNGRTWTKHGKIPYVTYAASTATTSPATKPGKIDSVREVQEWLNSTYSAKLAVDNKYGKNTKAALVKALQTELGFTGEDVDGIYGPKTEAAVKALKRGSEGALVKILQAVLVCNGYSGAYVDGIYGSGTESAVEQVQRKGGLTVDGIAGKNTMRHLLGSSRYEPVD